MVGHQVLVLIIGVRSPASEQNLYTNLKRSLTNTENIFVFWSSHHQLTTSTKNSISTRSIIKEPIILTVFSVASSKHISRYIPITK